MKQANLKKSDQIDIVIPWVDGNDPAWQEERNKYSGLTTSSVHSYNYQEWGLLKFFFRSIEKNAPWAGKVYFITWGHLPEWLNTENPDLIVVRHSDYIPEKYLPTFNSHTIELNIHRIKGLSEQFVYFNDDTYLTNKTDPEDFFVDGLPCDSAIVNPIAPSGRNTINSLQFTHAAVINEHFSKRKVIKDNPLKWFNYKYGSLMLLNAMFLPWSRFPGLLEKHIPSSFLKSTFDEVWSQENELLDQTCSHKFRDFKTDVNQWIMKEWQIASGNFEPRSTKCGSFINVNSRENAVKAAELIRNQKYKMLCVNDHLDELDQESIGMIRDAFEALFPDKSCFEK